MLEKRRSSDGVLGADEVRRAKSVLIQREATEAWITKDVTQRQNEATETLTSVSTLESTTNKTVATS